MAETVRVMIEEEAVEKRIRELGEMISRDYAGKQVHLICVLKGGVFFMCELAKRITVPVSMDFMSVGSYGDGTSSSGVVKIVKDLDEPLEGKDVLIVEDIIDSGRTLSYLIEILHKRHPASISLANCAIRRGFRVLFFFPAHGAKVKSTVSYSVEKSSKFSCRSLSLAPS